MWPTGIRVASAETSLRSSSISLDGPLVEVAEVAFAVAAPAAAALVTGSASGRGRVNPRRAAV